MKLYFDKRPFSFDDEYTIYEETGEAAYRVKAESGKKVNSISLRNRNDMEIGTVLCKKKSFGRYAFEIYLDTQLLGTVEKSYAHRITRYVLNVRRWKVYGNIMSFEYDIYDEQYLVVHAGNEDGAFPGKYVIDTSYSNNEQAALLVAFAMEAANSTLKERR